MWGVVGWGVVGGWGFHSFLFSGNSCIGRRGGLFFFQLCGLECLAKKIKFLGKKISELTLEEKNYFS